MQVGVRTEGWQGPTSQTGNKQTTKYEILQVPECTWADLPIYVQSPTVKVSALCQDQPRDASFQALPASGELTP